MLTVRPLHFNRFADDVMYGHQEYLTHDGYVYMWFDEEDKQWVVSVYDGDMPVALMQLLTESGILKQGFPRLKDAADALEQIAEVHEQ